jgi:hypothetical protein
MKKLDDGPEPRQVATVDGNNNTVEQIIGDGVTVTLGCATLRLTRGTVKNLAAFQSLVCATKVGLSDRPSYTSRFLALPDAFQRERQ